MVALGSAIVPQLLHYYAVMNQMFPNNDTDYAESSGTDNNGLFDKEMLLNPALPPVFAMPCVMPVPPLLCSTRRIYIIYDDRYL